MGKSQTLYAEDMPSSLYIRAQRANWEASEDGVRSALSLVGAGKRETGRWRKQAGVQPL